MATKAGIRPDEGLMMMQELDDRLKEQNDKLEHVRLAAVELKDNLSGVNYTGNKSLSIRTTVWSNLFFMELSSVLTLFSSNTEQQWSKPVYRWPSGVVESLVRASGDSSHEHNCFHPGEKGMQFLMGSWLYFYLWPFLGAHLVVHSALSLHSLPLHLFPDEPQASRMGGETGFQTRLPLGTPPPDWRRSVGVWLVPHPHAAKQWCRLRNVL